MTSPIPATATPPPLREGDRLGSAEFERRFHAMPTLKKAELIDGVVAMPSPIHFQQHTRPQALMVHWLMHYAATTPNVLAGGDTTLRLDARNVVQPDALLMIDPARGGRCRIAADDYLEGPPELVVEVAATTLLNDQHRKRAVYERLGVREYLLWRVADQAIDWWVWRDGAFVALDADAAGVIRSEVFPGLWLDTVSMIRLQTADVVRTLQLGLTDPSHEAFVKSLLSTDEPLT
jgi:Uma2 family endonuclease